MPPPYSVQGCLYKVQGQKPSVPGSEPGLNTGFGQPAVYFAAGANTYLTEDWGSCLAKVSEQMCVKKSLKWGYPCAVPAKSPRAAPFRLHPLPPSGSGVGGSFGSRRAAYAEEISAVPCPVLLGQQRSQVLTATVESVDFCHASASQRRRRDKPEG